MARLTILDTSYTLGDDLGLELGRVRIEDRSPTGFTLRVGDDLAVFRGTGFTYRDGGFELLGTQFTLGSDAVTGGTITSYEFREDGVPSFVLDGISESARSLVDLSTLAGRNGPLLFDNVLRGDDTARLAAGNDRLDLEAGNDVVTGGGGADELDGGPGLDVAVFEGSRSGATVITLGDRTYVRDGAGAVDTLRNFETLRFSDGDVPVPPAGRDTALEYIASYPDLVAAYGADAEAGRRHLEAFGLREGREVGFDGYEYIASHPDLIRAYGADQDAGARHYIAFGLREWRDTDDFDAATYLAKYPDLTAAFGTDEQAAAIHFIRHGFAEGRTDDPFA